jgi:hypothetical protein
MSLDNWIQVWLINLLYYLNIWYEIVEQTSSIEKYNRVTVIINAWCKIFIFESWIFED